jgi:hypothetical protein
MLTELELHFLDAMEMSIKEGRMKMPYAFLSYAIEGHRLRHRYFLPDNTLQEWCSQYLHTFERLLMKHILVAEEDVQRNTIFYRLANPTELVRLKNAK